MNAVLILLLSDGVKNLEQQIRRLNNIHRINIRWKNVYRIGYWIGLVDPGLD